MKQGTASTSCSQWTLLEAALGGFHCPIQCLGGPCSVCPYDPASQTSHHSLFGPVSVLPDPSPALKVKNKEKDPFHLCCWRDAPSQHGSGFPSKKERIEFCHSKEEEWAQISTRSNEKKTKETELGLVLKLGRLLQSWSSCSQCCWKDLGRFGPNPTVIPSLPVQFDVLLLPQHFWS